MVEEQNKTAILQNDSISQPVPEKVNNPSNVIASNGEPSNKQTTEHSTPSIKEETIRKVFKTNKRKNTKADEGTRLFLRRERDKIRQRLARMHEDEEKRRQRLEKDKMRKRLSRQLENDFDKLRRRDKDRERQALKRKFEKEQREKKKSRGDNAFNERVSMVDIGSTIVIKDTQIAVEHLNEEIKVTVEIADEEGLREIKNADDDDHLEEERVSDNQHLEVVKLADGVCLQEVKVTDVHFEEIDVTNGDGSKEVVDSCLEKVRHEQQKSGDCTLKGSKGTENLKVTNNKDNLIKESQEICDMTENKSSKESKKTTSTTTCCE